MGGWPESPKRPAAPLRSRAKSPAGSKHVSAEPGGLSATPAAPPAGPAAPAAPGAAGGPGAAPPPTPLVVPGGVSAHDQRIHRRQLARHVDDAQLPGAVARDEEDEMCRPRRRAVDGQSAERFEGEGLLGGGMRRDEAESGERGEQADGTGFHAG